MTYRDPEVPLVYPPARPAGTQEDPHPYGYGRWRCPKCGGSMPLLGPLKTSEPTHNVLRVQHPRPFVSGPDCFWFTRTYEDSPTPPKPSPTIQEDHLRTEVYVGRVFLALFILVGFLHVCLAHT